MPESRVKLRLDPWPADYEGPIQISTFDEPDEEGGRVDFRVETSRWEAVAAPSRLDPADLVFVDGVRRIEARVLTDSDGPPHHGLFGSYAAGSVRATVEPDPFNPAHFQDLRVGRRLILGGGSAPDEEVRCGGVSLNFRGLPFPGNSPTEALSQLQYLMRLAETELAEAVVGPRTTVFVDGPLTFFSDSRLEMAGIVKRLFVAYLPAREFNLVANLKTAHRTPVFSIEESRHDRYAWFLRVTSGRPLDHPLSGVLRLEVRSGVGLETAVRLADQSTAWLPRFASDPIRDPRAPQNLLPVGALERELTRRLGDPLLIRRAIECKLHEELAA